MLYTLGKTFLPSGVLGKIIAYAVLLKEITSCNQWPAQTFGCPRPNSIKLLDLMYHAPRIVVFEYKLWTPSIWRSTGCPGPGPWPTLRPSPPVMIDAVKQQSIPLSRDCHVT